MSSLGTLAINQFITYYLFDNPVLSTFYSQLYTDYNPDVTGYTLLFMKEPDLSGYDQTKILTSDSFTTGLGLPIPLPTAITSFEEFTGWTIFLAHDFTPPQTQVQTGQIAARSGAFSFASDFSTTETMTVTYFETNPLSVYKFHLLWVQYMKDVLRGKIAPHEKYLGISNSTNTNLYYGAIDYLASFYIVKYMPDMKEINYISKCTGVFPISLPSKELIGTRTTNEITLLPFEYSCISYHEYVDGMTLNDWILTDFTTNIASKFTIS